MASSAALFQSVTTSARAGTAMLDARFMVAMQAMKRRRLEQAFIGRTFRRQVARLYALADFCVKIIPTDCFYGERVRLQHWQCFLGFGRRKFPIEVPEVFFAQFDVD